MRVQFDEETLGALAQAVIDGLTGGSGGALEATQLLVKAAVEIVATAAASTDPAEAVGFLKTIAVAPTVESTPDYATGDVIGGKNTLASILRADGKTGYITAVRIHSKVDITVQIDCFFFNADPSASTFTENAAVALDAADTAKLLGVAHVSTWSDLGTPCVGFAECRIPITGAAAADIWMVMVARGAINLASTSDLTVAVTVDQN